MSAPPRGFQTSEYEARLARAQTLMDENGFNALLVMTEPEVRYFTGFHTQFWLSPTRPWFVIIPASGKPIAVVPTIGATAMADQFVQSVESWSSPGETDGEIDLLVDILDRVAGTKGRIALPMGPESTIRMPLANFNKLKTRLNRELFDATDLIRELRIIKSDAEIEKIAHAANIASQVFAKSSELFRPGQTQFEAFRAFKIACLNQGADDIPYLAMGVGQDGYQDVISLPSDAKIAPDDVLMLDTGLTYDGYYCDFDRNFCFRKPSAELQHAHETLWNATEEGLSFARSGVRCQEVYAAMNNVITRAGYSVPANVGRYGHGLGLQLTEWPSMASFDRTAIRDHMVLTLEPSLTMENGRCLVAEENIVVRGNTCDLLSVRAPREITVL